MILRRIFSFAAFSIFLFLFIQVLATKETKNLSYVFYQEGTLPIIISVPHDGDLQIDNVAERNNTTGSVYFSKAQDTYTKQIALEISENLEKRTGKKPFLVIDLLSRKYMDANRNVSDAYEDSRVKKVYAQYNQNLTSAIEKVGKGNQTGVLVDLHGQSQLPEDLYIITLNGKSMEKSKEESLRQFLQSKGYVVSLSNPEKFEISGIIIDRFGKHRENGIDAFEIEVQKSIRYDKTRREKFVKDFSEALLFFTKTQ